jgi:hypothetical protein
MDDGRRAWRTAIGLDRQETMRDGELQPLLHALARIVVEGTPGAGSFVIIEGGGAFVQFAGTRGDTELWCEAVSNHYLDPERRLEAEQIERLHRNGDEAVRGGGDGGRDTPRRVRVSAGRRDPDQVAHGCVARRAIGKGRRRVGPWRASRGSCGQRTGRPACGREVELL